MFGFFSSQAQDTTKVDVLGKNIVTVDEDSDKTHVEVLSKKIEVNDDYNSDTTTVRVGKKLFTIVEDGGSTQIYFDRDESWIDEDDKKPEKLFNGHWAGFEIGVNSFYNESYNMYYGIDYVLPYSGDGFMELEYPKSLEVNLNFMEYNIALKKNRIGIVTGMGWSIKNYKFNEALTINKVDGMILPVYLEEDNLKKSKLTVSYLTVPLLLECQIPVNDGANQLFLSGGIIGGINLGSHTKIKYDDSKSKDHGSFNINPFQYSLTARVGLKDISLYGTYSLNPLFKDDKGPELFPFSIGLSLINF